MQGKLSNKTIGRLSEITQKPISRGVDSAVNEVCDKYEELAEKDTKPFCKICMDDEQGESNNG